MGYRGTWGPQHALFKKSNFKINFEVRSHYPLHVKSLDFLAREVPLKTGKSKIFQRVLPL